MAVSIRTWWRRITTAAEVAVVVAAIAGGLMARHQVLEARQAARQREREAIEARGLLVAERASRARLEREAADLRGQLERLREASHGARLRTVARLESGMVSLAGRPGAAATAAKRDQTPSTESPFPTTFTVAAPGNPPSVEPDVSSHACADCKIRLQISVAEVDTRAGNVVVLGTARVLDAGTGAELAKVPLRVTGAWTAAPPARSGWWAGPGVGVGPGGAWAGGLVAGPSKRIGHRLAVRPWGVVLGGPGGAIVAAGVAVGW